MRKNYDKIKVLLIENGSDWLVDVYAALIEANFDVVVSTGGDRGFCTARIETPDLIICEAGHLSDISGIQLCYMIRADSHLRSTLFVLMGDASSNNCDIAAESFQAGADEYFEKNCNRRFLVAKISRLIALQRSEAVIEQGYENLISSELSLRKLIDDACNLVTNLTTEFGVHNFDQESQVSLEDLDAWKQEAQNNEFIQRSKVKKEKCETIYYEIIS